jgi:S-ribosylhomocysteine lyase LuxS involved in autoinducer biosynthesis
VKIPGTFQVLGTTWSVHIVSPAKWVEEDGCVGISDFKACEVRLVKSKRDLMEHVYLHELTHVVLGSMNHALQTNEKFVDVFAGLLHQALTTGK